MSHGPVTSPPGPAAGGPAAAPAPQLLVACLCAAWCSTCTSYRDTMRAVAAQRPEWQFAWIDIEDDADALGDDSLDIKTFPTLMVLRDGQPLFHGVLLPHAATLQRLLLSLDQAPAGAAGAAALAAPSDLAAAVWRVGPQRPL